MKKLASICEILVLAATGAAQSPPAISPDIGVYLGWVGTHPGNRLKEGARLAKEAGFQTIRIPLVASVETDFGIGSACSGKHTLEDIVSLPPYAEVLTNPAFRTILLTVWGDSNSYEACDARNPRNDQHEHKRYLEKAFYSIQANRDRMRDEYANLTYRIYKTYQDSGKVFGISNWEGDNELYCDAAWYFAKESAFRSSCEGKRDTGDVVAAYREFLALRQEGIDSGRKRASLDGLRNVSVVSIIEVSAFRFLKEGGLPNMLDDVIPFAAAPDYVSYSAWESIGSTDVLLSDLNALEKRFKGHVIVGEFGFDRGLDPSAAEHAATSLATMQAAHTPYAILWQIFDQPPLLGLGDKGLYGVYDDAGKLTPTGNKVLEKFAIHK